MIDWETLIDLGLGITIDFLGKQITWNGISAEMKDPTPFNNEDNLYSITLQVDPEKYQEILDCVILIMEAGREKESNLEKC